MSNRTNRIGLDVKQSELLSTKLNELLANYQIFYMNTRGFHWNIKGNKFFELHLKFEELYNDCLLYTSPSPRDLSTSRMPSSA